TPQVSSPAEIQAATNVVRGTVLLVDPDDKSRGVARYVLNRHGYRVIEADSGALALMLWDGQARNVDLLLTDMVLPGSSGFDLASQLRQSRADLKVIYACANESEMSSQNLPGENKYITKPYRSEQLAECVEAFIPSAAN